MYLEMAISK